MYLFKGLNPWILLLLISWIAFLCPWNVFSQTNSISILQSLSKQSTELSSSYVKDMVISHNILYLATAKGLSRYHLLDKKWLPTINTASGLSHNYCTSLLWDDTYLWIGTVRGLNRFSPETNDIRVFTQENSAIEEDYITSLTSTKDEIWVGTRYLGMVILNKQTNQYRSLTKLDGLKEHQISTIKRTNDRIWIGTTNGLHYYHTFQKSIYYESDLGTLPITALDIRGEYLYLGITDGGLVRYDPITKSKSTVAFSNNTINRIYVDGDWIWVTTKQGLGWFDTTNQTEHLLTVNDGLLANEVNGMVVHGNQLWVGTDVYNGGIQCFNKWKPQVQFSAETGYIEPNVIEVTGTTFDYSNITSIRVLSKIGQDTQDYSDELFVFYQSVKKSYRNEPLGKIELKLPDNYSGYLFIKLMVENDQKQSNSISYRLPITNIPPQITVDEIPLATGFQPYKVHGTFIEPYLYSIVVKNNAEEAPVDLDWEKRTFSYPWNLLEGENALNITIRNIAFLSVTVPLKIIYIHKEPIVQVAQTSYTSENDFFSIPITVIDPYVFTLSIEEGNIKLAEINQDDTVVYQIPWDRKQLEETYSESTPLTFGLDQLAIKGPQATFALMVGPLQPGENKFTFRARNLAYLSSSKEITVNFSSNRPILLLDETMQYVYNTQKGEIKGTCISKKNVEQIFVMPGNIQGTIKRNADPISFIIPVPINKESEEYIIKSVDSDGTPSRERTVVLYYRPDLEITGYSPDDKNNLSYDERFKEIEERMRMLEEENNSKTNAIFWNEMEGRIKNAQPLPAPIIPKERTGVNTPVAPAVASTSILVVPFVREEGDSLQRIATKYLGSPNYYTKILLFNAGLSKPETYESSTMLVPTSAFFGELYKSKNGSNYLQWIIMIARIYKNHQGNVAPTELTNILASSSYAKSNQMQIAGKYLYNASICLLLAEGNSPSSKAGEAQSFLQTRSASSCCIISWGSQGITIDMVEK